MERTAATPSEDWTMAELFARRPAAVITLSRLGMACPGCAMAPFEPVAEAAAIYHFSTEDLLRIVCARSPPRPSTQEEPS